MRRGAKRAIIAVVVLALLAAWVLIPHPLEGPVLFTISADHGVHLGDLIGVVVAGVVLWWFAVRRRR
jgi:hypothetical protein